jgi:hypothetical protein
MITGTGKISKNMLFVNFSFVIEYGIPVRHSILLEILQMHQHHSYHMLGKIEIKAAP